MDTATYDFTIRQGVDEQLVVQLTDDSDVPINLTGYTARMQIRKTISDAAKLYDGTTENGLISIDAVTGTITVSIPNATTTAITDAKGVYDLELIDANSKVSRPIEGAVTVSKQVTR